MTSIKEIISEIISALKADADLKSFCVSNYGKDVYVDSGEMHVNDIPIKNIPVAMISDGYGEVEKKRFLYNENEVNLLISCGIMQKDTTKAKDELISLKELIKLALKKDPLLNEKATYSTIIKSKRIKHIPHPLYFMELTMYVNYKAV